MRADEKPRGRAGLSILCNLDPTQSICARLPRGMTGGEEGAGVGDVRRGDVRGCPRGVACGLRAKKYNAYQRLHEWGLPHTQGFPSLGGRGGKEKGGVNAWVWA